MHKRMTYIRTRVQIAVWVALLFQLALIALTALFLPACPAAAAAALLLSAGAAYAGYRCIYLPFRETTKIMQLFASGYTVQDVFKIRYPISAEFEAMMNRMQEMFSAQELISASKKQAQYLALQNQINPHFLYNTLEGIRGEAISAKMTNVAEMTEALATFFRYTISNVENLVSLGDELQNVHNYFLIQRYRFGERLALKIRCDTADMHDVYKCQIPKLTLQPIVENAIIHGVEQKVGQGIVTVRIETTAKRLLITISDNGMGMPPEQLMRLNERLNVLIYKVDAEKADRHEGIAMVNVNNRIKLLFGEEYGITVYSTPGVGTDVAITLPYVLQGVSLPAKNEEQADYEG